MIDSRDTKELIKHMEWYANMEIPTRPVEKASISDEIKNVRDNIGDTWKSAEYRQFKN